MVVIYVFVRCEVLVLANSEARFPFISIVYYCYNPALSLVGFYTFPPHVMILSLIEVFLPDSYHGGNSPFKNSPREGNSNKCKDYDLTWVTIQASLGV